MLLYFSIRFYLVSGFGLVFFPSVVYVCYDFVAFVCPAPRLSRFFGDGASSVLSCISFSALLSCPWAVLLCWFLVFLICFLIYCLLECSALLVLFFVIFVVCAGGEGKASGKWEREPRVQDGVAQVTGAGVEGHGC